MRAVRSRVHMLTVAAARLEQEHGNPKLIADLREAAECMAAARAEGRFIENEERRIEHQRTLFAALYPNNAADRLKQAMLQRCYDLMWDGDPVACDALAEFLPEADVQRVFDAWENDTFGREPRSAFYGGSP